MIDIKKWCYKTLPLITCPLKEKQRQIALFQELLARARKRSAEHDRFSFYLSCHAAVAKIPKRELKLLCDSVVDGDVNAAAELAVLLTSKRIRFAWAC